MTAARLPGTLATAIALACAACASAPPPHTFRPAAGYVPDAATAIRIAVAVWEPIYGRDTIAGEAPYVATLKDGAWHVEGSLPAGWVGGTAVADISKADGTILRVSHGR